MRWVASALVAVAGCGDAPVAPLPEPLRTVLVHRQDTGENLLLNSDGSDAGAYAPGPGPLLALGASAVGQALVLLHGDAIVIGALGQPALDTILRPAPTSLSLASISDDERLVALVSYEPTRGLIVYDRANHAADTLDYGSIDPVLPPVLAPADDRVLLFGLTQLAFTVTVIDRSDPGNPESSALLLSRFLNRPIFGWPRWLDDGVHLAFVRVADGAPDTLVVGRIAPDDPSQQLEEQFRAVMAPESDDRPELAIGGSSTYALTADARALALGAIPERGAGRQAIYLVTPSVARVQLVRDAPEQFLAFPLFTRR